MRSFTLSFFLFIWSSLTGASSPSPLEESHQPSLTLAKTSCASPLAADTPKDFTNEHNYLCQLPEKIKSNTPSLYWYSFSEYRQWLQTNPTAPSAAVNYGASPSESDAKVNAHVLAPDACHYYSSISPSVQTKQPYVSAARTWIVSDIKDLIQQCRQFSKELKQKKHRKCSSIEFAGHATQPAAVDTLFSVEPRRGPFSYFPSKKAIKTLGKCLRKISLPNAPVILSTCGGDQVTHNDGTKGQTHYWPEKKRSQKVLSRLLNLPVLSGIGVVEGAPNGGVLSTDGWHFSLPE